MTIHGTWLPLITPFRDGALDEVSLRRMARHYVGQPIDGFILAATTGEGLTIDEEETERLVAIVAGEIAGRVPVFLGLSGSDTRKMTKALAHTASMVGRWLSRRVSVLHAALAGRALSPLRGARGRNRAADPRLQHPVPHRREHGQRHAAAPR